MEYVDHSGERGVLYAFHGTDVSEKTFRCVLEGLRPSQSYHLRFHDHSAADRTASGAELMRQGITLSLPLANSSELVFFDATGS